MLSVTLVPAQFGDLVQFQQSEKSHRFVCTAGTKKMYHKPAELPRFDYHLHIYANRPHDFCGSDTKQKGFLQFILEGGGGLV